MSLQDSIFAEDAEYDVTVFSQDKRRKRVLVFPPVNNYRRYIIHQLVQDRFADLHTFSIGQGNARRIVVCYKSDVIRDPKLNGGDYKTNSTTRSTDSSCEMGVEGRRSPSASPEHVRVNKQVKSVPSVEIYRPPAARKARNNQQSLAQQQQQPQQQQAQVQQPVTDSSSFTKTPRQKRPDRAVYVPRHRRSLATEGSPQSSETCRSSRANHETSTSSPVTPEVSRITPNHRIKERDLSESRNERDTSVSKTELSSCDSTKHSFISDKSNSECVLDECVQTNLDNRTSNRNKTSEINECVKEDYECVSEDKEINASNNIVPSTSQIVNIKEYEETIDHKEIEEISSRINKDESLNELRDVVAETSENETDGNHYESLESNMQNESNNKTNNLDNKTNNLRPRTIECDDNVIMSCNVENRKTSEKVSCQDETVNKKNKPVIELNKTSGVLIISDKMSNEQRKTKETPVVPMAPPEKKVKKIERPKSKPAPPPTPPVKINRDECDWDSLFDDNGDCLDPTLIEELTSSVGEVTIEQPKNDYKAYSRQVEVSSDEFGHVVEIYNFPSDFKTSDLAAVFSPFKNGGFELKWVDDTHCLGVFSSPLVAAEVLASDHPFVKTRPLSEATTMSKTKARRSAEFLQPYRTRPETCAALARRLVTGALGVRLATARQEREREKNILREAKEKRRLANKQREDAWEGIFPEK